MSWKRFALAAIVALLFVRTAPAAEIAATGKTSAEFASFDTLLTAFVEKHELPGAALAVARDGKLVYARGFGYADKDRKETVEPAALFRIASISKPITAVAVLQLVERGKLKLDDRVFDVLHLQAPDEATSKFDARCRQITILQLLQHTGGWNRDKSFDPMFRSPTIVKELNVAPPAGPDAIIRYMLRQQLDFEPGKDYAYSNFGYCLLGRVIENVTGQEYEAYVCNEVLKPLDITRMKLGKTLLKDRAPGEVLYYAGDKQPAVLGPNLGQPVPSPYGAWSVEAMDAHGAWIASAEDLVRFGAAFNEPAKCKILSESSIKTMFARPEGKPGLTAKGNPRSIYYACGWQVRPKGEGQFDTWHTGSLPGTSTLLVRRHDNLTWAVLFNSRSGAKRAIPSQAIDALLHEAVDTYLNIKKEDATRK